MIAVETALALRRAGLEVVYLAGDAGRSTQLEEAGVVVHGVGNLSLLQRPTADALRAGLYDGAAKQKIEGWLKQYCDDRAIIHVHGYMQTLSPSLFDALRPYRGRIVLHAHDFFYVCPTGTYFNFVQGRNCAVAPMSAACLLSACDKRSQAHKPWRMMRTALVRRGYRLLGAPPVVMLHAGMAPILEKAIPRERLLEHRNPVTPWLDVRLPAEANANMLYVGRITPEKGPDIVAEACRQAGAPLVMLGDGPMREELMQRYPEVTMPGWKQPSEIAEYLHQARTLILATRQREAFGLTAFEAGLSGLPVIVSSNALASDEIEAAGFGVRANPERIGVLAALIASLRADDARIAAMSHAGFAARARFALTPDAYAAGLIKLYERVAAGAVAATPL